MESFTQGNLIRIGKAAKIIGVSIYTLRRWEKAGLLPVAFKSAKGTRYYSRQLINKMTTTYVEDSALAPATVGQTKPADKPIATALSPPRMVEQPVRHTIVMPPQRPMPSMPAPSDRRIPTAAELEARRLPQPSDLVRQHLRLA